MKKIRSITAIILMVVAVFLSACGTQKEPGDAYNEGSDYQYMFDDQLNKGLDRAYGENGYYFLQGHYIYFMDDETHTLVSLCSKADCMHNEETNPERYADCNAYVEDESADCIAYSNGYVYVLDGNGFDSVLYRITTDGSNRDVVKSWDYDEGEISGTISNGMVHRDMFYYVKHIYYEVDEEIVEDYLVMQLPLTGTNQKERVIYEEPEGVYLFSFSNISAYGNYVYFTVLGNTTDDSGLYLGDEYWKYSYFHMFVYHTEDETLGEITPPEAADAEEQSYVFTQVAFWNGRIVLASSSTGLELGDSRTVYIADLDGSNMEALLEDEAYGNHYSSDGRYLYVSNYGQAERGLEEGEFFRVYDSDMNLVDTFTTPFTSTWNVGAGKEEGIYFWAYGEDDLEADGETALSMSLCFFDKGSIGTLNGDALSYSEVARWEASPADLD